MTKFCYKNRRNSNRKFYKIETNKNKKITKNKAIFLVDINNPVNNKKIKKRNRDFNRIENGRPNLIITKD